MMNMGLKGYNDEWRRDRRILHQRFRRDAAPSLYPIELAKTQELLINLMETPNDFTTHFKTYGGPLTIAKITKALSQLPDIYNDVPPLRPPNLCS
jgi:hypothetical protein